MHVTMAHGTHMGAHALTRYAARRCEEQNSPLCGTKQGSVDIS